MRFASRVAAGKLLADRLAGYAPTRPVVLALPRGGVVVAAEVARALHAPMDIIAVRKIGHPADPEYAIGAIDVAGTMILGDTDSSVLDSAWLQKAAEEEQAEASRRDALYRDGRDPLPLEGKTVIIVDDGIATGLTMRLAVSAAQKAGARHIIVAVPVAPAESVAELKRMGTDVIVLEPPDEFEGAVGTHYMEFDQVSDEEVVSLMHKCAA